MLVDGKGVHREMESEGSPRQKSEPTNRNSIRRSDVDEFAQQNEIQYCTEHQDVNTGATWTESVSVYPERSVNSTVRGTSEYQTKQTVAEMSNWIWQKSAEVIVPFFFFLEREGLNVKKRSKAFIFFWFRCKNQNLISELSNRG